MTTTGSRMRRIVRTAGLAGLWLVTVLVALWLVDQGWSKFEHGEGWRLWFTRWGYPAWFVPVIGVMEIGGAVLLLVPRLAPYAAALLIGVLSGALYTVTTNETDLSWFDPLLGIVLLLTVLVARRPPWLRRPPAARAAAP